MHLSRNSLDTLIDLVENKLSAMEVWDRGDRRELNQLRRCLHELTALSSGNGHESAFAPQRRRRGRPPKNEAAAV